MIGTFNVSRCSERCVFIHSTKFQVQSVVKGAKCHPVKDMEVLQISEKWMFQKDSKKNTSHDAKRCNDTKHFTTCLPNWLTSGEVTVFWKFSPPSLHHTLSWWKSFTVQPRFLASLGCPKFGIDFSSEVL